MNKHETDNHQVDQSGNDIQQEMIALRQTVDAWNEEDLPQQHDPTSEEQPEAQYHQEVTHLHLEEGHDNAEIDPPRLSPPASMAGSVFWYNRVMRHVMLLKSKLLLLLLLLLLKWRNIYNFIL